MPIMAALAPLAAAASSMRNGTSRELNMLAQPSVAFHPSSFLGSVFRTTLAQRMGRNSSLIKSAGAVAQLFDVSCHF